MKRVRIISGLYGYRPKEAKRPQPAPAGSVVEVPDGEAVRLAAIGVGAIVEDQSGEAAAAGAGMDTHSQEEPAEGGETGCLDPARLEGLTVSQLRELAGDMGIDTGKLRTKPELLRAIAAAGDSVEDDGEAPPELGAGDIVS